MSQATDKTKPKPVNFGALAEILRMRADLLDQIEEEAETLTQRFDEPGDARFTFREMLSLVNGLGLVSDGEYADIVTKLQDSSRFLQEAVDIERVIVDRLLAITEKQQAKQISALPALYYPPPYGGPVRQVQA